MAVYLRELGELEKFITLARSVSENDWRTWREQADKLPQQSVISLAELLDQAQSMGPTHLEALREYKRTEQNKGCLPGYFWELCPT